MGQRQDRDCPWLRLIRELVIFPPDDFLLVTLIVILSGERNFDILPA